MVSISIVLFEVDDEAFPQLAEEKRLEGNLKFIPKPEFRKTLQRLLQKNLAKVNAEPTLKMHMGRAGSLLSGGEFPIPTSEKAGQKPEFQEFGIKAELTPLRRANGIELVLKYTLEVSQRNFNNAPEIDGTTIPTVSGNMF